MSDVNKPLMMLILLIYVGSCGPALFNYIALSNTLSSSYTRLHYGYTLHLSVNLIIYPYAKAQTALFCDV